MRKLLIGGAALVAILAACQPAAAQSFGIGGRFSFMKPDVDVDADSQRFTGGHIRAKTSPRTALELSLDRRSETNDAETTRIVNYPIQISLLMFPVRATFAPYVLGGGGWYSQKIESLSGGETVASETVRDFGWHGGFGAELALGRHAGIHADYRYTFLKFGDDEEEERSGLLTRFLPSYKGSMWTAGLTIYF